MNSALVSELRRLLSVENGIELALLFGSQTTVRRRPDSDVDLALRAPGLDALALAQKLSLALGTEVDIVDIDAVGYPLLRELVENGVVVAEHVPGAVARWWSYALSTLDIDRAWFDRMRDGYLAHAARGS